MCWWPSSTKFPTTWEIGAFSSSVTGQVLCLTLKTVNPSLFFFPGQQGKVCVLGLPDKRWVVHYLYLYLYLQRSKDQSMSLKPGSCESVDEQLSSNVVRWAGRLERHRLWNQDYLVVSNQLPLWSPHTFRRAPGESPTREQTAPAGSKTHVRSAAFHWAFFWFHTNRVQTTLGFTLFTCHVSGCFQSSGQWRWRSDADSDLVRWLWYILHLPGHHSPHIPCFWVSPAELQHFVKGSMLKAIVDHQAQQAKGRRLQETETFILIKFLLFQANAMYYCCYIFDTFNKNRFYIFLMF